MRGMKHEKQPVYMAGTPWHLFPFARHLHGFEATSDSFLKQSSSIRMESSKSFCPTNLRIFCISKFLLKKQTNIYFHPPNFAKQRFHNM